MTDDDRDRTVLAAIVALLTFIVCYLLITVLAFATLPDNWGVDDYATVAELMAEDGLTVVEIVVPGLVAALVYKLIREK